MKQKLLSVLFVLICLIGQVFAQTKTIKGKVVGDSGEPLAGVTVSISGQTLSLQTDAYGNFQIQAKPGDELFFRYLGFDNQTVKVGANATLSVKLKESSRDLDEVIVTAYGKQTKESIVGSVASIGAKELEKRPVSSATAALEGAAPGIQVNNSYGEPGSSPSIRIRGISSVNGNNNPAIVVDGVVFGGNIADINPADIQSISVLKDATSGSLYGNRAAAGVIVITTKRGRSGSSLNLTVNQGLFTRGISEYETVTPQEYMEAAWQGYRNQLMTNNSKLSLADANKAATRGLVPSILKTNIFDLPDGGLFDENGKMLTSTIKGTYAEDLNWFKPTMRNGYRQEYLLSGNGGTEKGNYMFSTGYLDEKAYVKSSDFKRFSGRLSAEIKPTKWLTTGLNANATHQLINNTNGSGSGFSNVWMFARNIAPIYPVHKHDPKTGEYVLDSYNNKIYDNGLLSRNQYINRHVLWETEANSLLKRRNTVNSQAFMNVNLLNNLKLSIVGDINLRYDETRTYENASIGDGAGNKGRGKRDIYNYKNYTFRQQLDYNLSIDGRHNFDAMAGHENYGATNTYLYALKTNEVFEGQTDLINYSVISGIYDYSDNDKTESYFGRLRYNFQEKYFLEGSFRREGTSRLHPDLRWGNFWSIGGTWMASKEDFIKEIDWINDLKVRAATGVVGNVTSATLYAWMATHAIGQNNNLPAFWKSSFGNPNLKWEGQQSSSIAIEGKLFNRLNFGIEYFDKRSKDLIFDVNLPISNGGVDVTTGRSTYKDNFGVMSNRGLELTFDADVIRSNGFKWNVGLNATIMKNKVLELPAQNRNDGIISSPFRILEGKSRFDYWLPIYKGVDMMTGQALYLADTEKYDPTLKNQAYSPFQQEINGVMYTRNASYAVRDYLGSAIPKIMGAINTNVEYKNFSFSGLFTYSLGGKGLDYSYMSLMSMTATPSNVHKDIKNSWTEAPAGMTASSENRINSSIAPQINYTNSQYNNATSSRFVFNNNYFVIKNIAVGYRLPQALSSRWKLSRMAVNFAVENVATFSHMRGFSPQQEFGGYSQNAFVPARTFSLGINLGL